MAKRGDHISRAFVREYLATTCGISLVEMEERQNETAADFEMVDSGRRVLIAELKTLEERRPSAESGWTVEVDADGIEVDVSRASGQDELVTTIPLKLKHSAE